MITVQTEAIDFIQELMPLLPLHWEELALNKDKVPLDPQYEEYYRRDAQGQLLIVTLRQRGQLIGYFIGFIAPGLHYKTCLTYTMDIFYVHPLHRGNGGGKMMVDFLEKELKRRKVSRTYMGTKCHKDAGWMFEQLGYEKVEVYYSKWLGE